MVLSDYEIARRCGFELKAPIDGNSFLDFIKSGNDKNRILLSGYVLEI